MGRCKSTVGVSGRQYTDWPRVFKMWDDVNCGRQWVGVSILTQGLEQNSSTLKKSIKIHHCQSRKTKRVIYDTIGFKRVGYNYSWRLLLTKISEKRNSHVFLKRSRDRFYCTYHSNELSNGSSFRSFQATRDGRIKEMGGLVIIRWKALKIFDVVSWLDHAQRTYRGRTSLNYRSTFKELLHSLL